jgi:hypothetical protein
MQIFQTGQTLPTWQKKPTLKRGGGSQKRTRLRKKQSMKRFGNLYGQICSLENLQLADAKARKRKAGNMGYKHTTKIGRQTCYCFSRAAEQNLPHLALYHLQGLRAQRKELYTACLTFRTASPTMR